MEEEGTVVYFKTSPSAQESQVGEEELTFVTTDTADTLTKSSPQSLPQPVKNKKFGRFKQFISQVWISKQMDYLPQLITELKTSPLLTEEDSHILQCSLAQKQMPSLAFTRHTRILFSLLALLMALVAVSVYMDTLTLIVVTLPLCILASIVVLKKRHHHKKVTSHWLDYLKQCEEMLSHLTKALRLIQETEILSRGYSKPSKAIPVSRLESCMSVDLQCIVLRKKVFTVCLTGVLLLRDLTKNLCTEVSTKEELDSAQSYLALRELASLHQHMRESCEEDEKYSSNKLTLESLKESCNLLAVQNSEFLRRLAIVLSYSSDPHTMLPLFERCLMQALQFVSTACRELKWSLQYQKDFLFSDPPTKVERKTADSSYHPELLPFVEEVHCLDLTLQLTLQGVRALGELLAERYFSGNRPSEEELTELYRQLSTTESNLARSGEHVSGGMVTLEEMMSPSSGGTSTPRNAPLPMNSEPVKEDTEHTEELSEEEDLVFEAYIPLGPSEDEQSEDSLTLEERQALEEAKDLPVNLLRELNSVLVVRNEARERKREERRAKKLKQTMGESQGSTHTDKPCSPMKELAFGGKKELDGKGLDMSVQEAEFKVGDKSTKRDELVRDSLLASVLKSRRSETESKTQEKLVEEPVRNTRYLGGANQRSLAQAVATIALRHRQQTEAVFEHSED